MPQAAIEWTLAQTDEAVFSMRRRPEFVYEPVPASFHRARCSKCREYVFERHARYQEGKTVCIPCSGYQR